MSQRILGSSWAGPVAQQEAFLAAFTAFMQRTFAPKLAQLKEASLRCRAEEIHGALAKVMASVKTPDGEVPSRSACTNRHRSGKSMTSPWMTAVSASSAVTERSCRGSLHTASFEEVLRVISDKNAR